jgi:hypothetical protein
MDAELVVQRAKWRIQSLPVAEAEFSVRKWILAGLSGCVIYLNIFENRQWNHKTVNMECALLGECLVLLSQVSQWEMVTPERLWAKSLCHQGGVERRPNSQWLPQRKGSWRLKCSLLVLQISCCHHTGVSLYWQILKPLNRERLCSVLDGRKIAVISVKWCSILGRFQRGSHTPSTFKPHTDFMLRTPLSSRMLPVSAADSRSGGGAALWDLPTQDEETHCKEHRQLGKTQRFCPAPEAQQWTFTGSMSHVLWDANLTFAF